MLRPQAPNKAGYLGFWFGDGFFAWFLMFDILFVWVFLTWKKQKQIKNTVTWETEEHVSKETCLKYHLEAV